MFARAITDKCKKSNTIPVIQIKRISISVMIVATIIPGIVLSLYALIKLIKLAN